MAYTIEINIALPRLRAINVLQAYKSIAAQVALHTGICEDVILDQMIEKEAHDNSAMGNGVAFPHLQMAVVDKRYVVMASLERPIHMDAPDKKPVDLICLLLSPDSDGPIHLRGLSRISRLLKNEELCQVLREAKDADSMKALFINPEGWLMAA